MTAHTKILRCAIAVSFVATIATLMLGFWIPVKAELAQILLERAWTEVRSGRVDTRPWPWADTSPIARLAIPEFGVSWIVLSGASGRNLAFAPSHMDGSALPGEVGVAMISGHRDTHFAALQHIQAGTEIVVESADGRRHVYRVTGTAIVDSRSAQIRLDSSERRLVLTTCYPFDAIVAGGPLRFIVEAAALTEPGN